MSHSAPVSASLASKKDADRAKRRAWNAYRDVSVMAAMERARVAALPPKKLPGDRLCLGCVRVFRSKWIGNRLCGDCS